MKKFIPLFLIALFPYSLISQNTFVKDSLDKYVNREMQKWQIPGVAVAIVKDGKVIVSKGYGVKDLDKKEKTDENTLFQIASNSKAFTATSLALLQYQKRMSLDDKVQKWMKEFKLYNDYVSSTVTIRDLLCHRIGFETFQSDMLNWGCTLSRKEIISKMKSVVPVYGFREKYGYCNSAFLTAGEIIPLVTDTSWDDFLKYNFFIPLKMNRTSTTWDKINSDNNACLPYTLVNGQLVKMPFVNIDNLGPAASINSCVKDLSNWLLMQLDSGRFEGKRIFPFEVLKATRQSQMIVRDNSNPLFPSKHFQTYGLGWFMEDYNGKKIIYHNGGANGFVTTTCFIPELNLGITVLTNTDANDLYTALRLQIIDAFMNLPYKNYSSIYYKNFSVATKIQDDEIKGWREIVAKKNNPPMDLKSFEGSYINSVYGTITINSGVAVINDPDAKYQSKLAIYFSHHPQLIGVLEYMENNTFLCTYSDPEYGVKKILFAVVGGKVKSVTVTVNDFIDFMPYEFTKE